MVELDIPNISVQVRVLGKNNKYYFSINTKIISIVAVMLYAYTDECSFSLHFAINLDIIH